MPEFVQGALLVLIGFAFAVAWDIFKNHRGTKAKDQTIIFALHKELISLKKLIKHNKSLLFPDSDEQFYDVPILPMKLNEAWHLVAFNLPKCLIHDSKLVDELLNIVNRCEILNGHIAARENFRVSQKALGGYGQVLKMYEKMLSKILEELEPLVTSSCDKVESLKV